jgi:DNA helicase-2/ATP-dependent DNA helicase PcrA
VATLDNWTAWLAASFPVRSGMAITDSAPDYRGARIAALQVLEQGRIRDLLAATYGRVLVDEYQDCCALQHRTVMALSGAVPTIAFGDPMQHVFDFNAQDRRPTWADIEAAFGQVWLLDKPWRWDNAGEGAFGQWILAQRLALAAGGKVDLRTGPSNVTWEPLPNDAAQHQARQMAAIPTRTSGASTLLVINDSYGARARDARRSIARSTGLAVVENADLPDLRRWAASLDAPTGEERLGQLLLFADEVMTGIDIDAIVDKLGSIQDGTNTIPATTEELMLLAYAGSPVPPAADAVLRQLALGRTVFRPDLFESTQDAARIAVPGSGMSLVAAAARVNRRRAADGRRVESRAIGSTLLLKGLEADHAVVLDADGMKPAHLYVAISRACRSLTIVSKSPLLPP